MIISIKKVNTRNLVNRPKFKPNQPKEGRMNRGGRKRLGLFISAPEPLEAGRHPLLKTSIPGAGRVCIPGRHAVASENFSAHQKNSISFFKKATVTFWDLNMQSGFLDCRSRQGRVEIHLI
jgi:hypothetical protein